jgi:predicted PurR-regulated permease PerM
METIIQYLKKPIFKRIFVFALLGLALYLLRSMASLLLLTFIFIYIFNSLQNLLYNFIRKHIRINVHIITAFIYVVFISLLVLIVRIYLPVLVDQISALITNITGYLMTLKDDANSDNIYLKMLSYVSTNVDISKYISSGGTSLIDFLKSVGTISLYVFLSLMLSLFFILEKQSIAKFFSRFRQSKLYWMYGDTRFFFKKFGNSFGKVIQNQIIISAINTALSVIVLVILKFPDILGLGAMVFVLGMVPVAGVFISMIPLTIIAYSTGGLIEVVYIVILVVVLHALEGYVLNPKLMSRTSKMPVFCTFLVLILSEHFAGAWGLIMGIPLTIVVLDVLDVVPDD